MSAAGAPHTTIVLVVSDDVVSERLQDVLASIRAQRRPASIVVVDNGLASTLAPLPGAWVLRAPQRSTVGAARNLGLTRVTTPYVVFWDADDFMLRGTLETLEAALQGGPQLAAFAMAGLERSLSRVRRWSRRGVVRLAQRPQAFALLQAIWPLYPSSGATIMRADLAREAGGFGDADSGADWPLGVSLAWRGQLGLSEQIGRRGQPQAGTAETEALAPPELRGRAHAIRERIRNDGGSPEWVRTALPLLWLVQEGLIGARAGLAWVRERLSAKAP